MLRSFLSGSLVLLWLLFCLGPATVVRPLEAKSLTVKDLSTAPQWLQDHMIYMTEGNGRWVTDNSAYKSETEVYDHYITEWKWGIGKNSIRGRLFGKKDEKETSNVWEFILFWHPKEKKAVLHQFGGSGVFGEGEMISVTDDGKLLRITEMTFYTPDGTSWKDLHQIFEKPGEHETVSFDYKDESWVRRRIYHWKKETVSP